MGERQQPAAARQLRRQQLLAAHHGVPDLAARCGRVITRVDPDVVTIQEGAGIPETEDFFDRFVDGDAWVVQRGAGGAQALVTVVRTDRDVTAVAPGSPVAGGVDLSDDMEADVDADLHVNPLRFAREPQVLNLIAHDRPVLLLNNHLKSKFVRNGETLFNNGGNDRLAFIADALVARRRISAEAFRIREYLDAVLEAEPEALVVVAGDLNDGPGSDFFEENYLTVVDRIFGSVFSPQRQLTHVLLASGSTDFTARFHDFIADEERDLVLDHIGVSPALSRWEWQARVAVEEYEAGILDDATAADRAGRDRLPSDHRPVVLETVPA